MEDNIEDIDPNFVHGFPKQLVEDFMHSCSIGCAERVERILNAHPSIVDIPLDDEGDTALMMATRYSQLDTIRILLLYGADVNAQDNWGYSPLIISARYGVVPVIELLVEAGANLNLRNFAGSTALIMASQYGKSAAAQYLVEHGASIDAKDKHGFNALSFTGFHSATVNAQKDQIRSILNALLK